MARARQDLEPRSTLGLKKIPGKAEEVVTTLNMAMSVHPRAKFTDPDEVYGLCRGFFQHVQELNEIGTPVTPDMYGLANWLGTTPATIDRYIKENINGCGDVLAWAKNTVAACLSQLAFNGKLNALVFTATMNNMHEWTTNKTQTEITHVKAEKPSIEQLLKEAEQLPIEGEFKEL